MMQGNNLNNLIIKPICFQSNNPNQIDLTLTNQKSMYKFSNIFKTGLSDHHKPISTTSNSGSFKGTPQIKVYRSYKHAPLKKKILRHNNGSFMTKELRNYEKI